LLVGFLPDDVQLSSLTINHDGLIHASSNGRGYRKCKNYSVHEVCNWMIPNEDDNEYCKSCQLTTAIPNLDDPENKILWYRMEQGKRRLLHTLIRLNLPVVNREKDPLKGISFQFLEDQVEDEYGNELTVKNYVMTGHNAGVITINLNEAEPSTRIEMREKMNERYRTLLGHFRHESGHYYWDRLIKGTGFLDEFRLLFGDERLNYSQAMKDYYAKGPSTNWQNVWISAYASMHPWEDWAETWAHYLHMLDTLETANDFEFNISNSKIVDPFADILLSTEEYRESSFTSLFNDWCSLTTSLNALNRSMGLDDAYPFVISLTALEKLRFVHQVVLDSN